MKIGILSDSHGNARRLSAALKTLRDHGAEAVVHCGDVGSDECFQLLAGSGMAAYAVVGNTDRHIDRLRERADELGLHYHAQLIEVPFDDGRYLVATHGDDEDLLGELIVGGQFPYVCHGHTHKIRDENYGKVRVICPGALHHPRSPKHPTTALLDTDSGDVEYLPVSDSVTAS
jgi:hypothetical protein